MQKFGTQGLAHWSPGRPDIYRPRRSPWRPLRRFISPQPSAAALFGCTVPITISMELHLNASSARRVAPCLLACSFCLHSLNLCTMSYIRSKHNFSVLFHATSVQVSKMRAHCTSARTKTIARWVFLHQTKKRVGFFL